MKKLLIALSALTFLAACQESTTADEAKTENSQEVAAAIGATYNADLGASKVSFVGSKPVGTHSGDFKLSSGSLTVENGNITSGSFVIDLNSMVITDKDTAWTGKLKAHLLDKDFFETSKYPTAKFEITKCEALSGDSLSTHTISGNLTLKDSTQNVTFPAKVTVSETDVNAAAKFSIDRTKWGLFYGNDKSLGDKFIYPEVEVSLNIMGKK